jgi:predicted deacylase
VLDFHSGGRTLDFLPYCAGHHRPDDALEATGFAAVAAFAAPWSMKMIEIDSVGMFDTAAERAVGTSGALRWSLLLVATALVIGNGAARASTAHTIFMTVLEATGATSTERLAPPPVDPANLSKSYGFKPPGEADTRSPHRWEVSSYLFSPSFVTVEQGDTVTLVVFVVNGDQHDVRLQAPDGSIVAPRKTLERGHEYRLSFTAKLAGTYHFSCAIHAPTLSASILALPR